MNNHFKHTFSKQDIEIHAVDDLYSGFVDLKKFHFKHKRFQGNQSKVVTREILCRKPAVVAIPFDPVLEQVVLIEELRIGALDDAKSPWLYEVPAGVLDVEGEDPRETVRREVLEETGLTTGRVMPICEYWSSPGATSEYIYAYCVEVDTSKASESFQGVEEESEDIRMFVVSAKEAFEAVAKGYINNGAGILSLYWLQMNYQKVMTQWGH